MWFANVRRLQRILAKIALRFYEEWNAIFGYLQNAFPRVLSEPVNCSVA